MKKRFVKMLVGALAGVMLAGCLTGCAPSDSSSIAKIGNMDLSYGEVNFYSRYMQSSYESYAELMGYGAEDFWKVSYDGVSSMYETMKGNMKNELEDMAVLYQNMDAYGVALTEEEKAAMETAADTFIASNDSETLKFMNASKENITKVLSLLTVRQKMRDTIIADVDTNVSDSEALQKKMIYAAFPYTADTSSVNSGAATEQMDQITDALNEAMTEANEGEMKEEAGDFLKAVEAMTEEEINAYAEEQGITVNTTTFDADDAYPSEELCKAAFALKKDQLTGVVQDADRESFYVAKLLSEKDADATEQAKETIASQRQNDAYTEALDAMKEGITIKWDDKKWDGIDFLKAGIKDNGGIPSTYQEDPTLEAADGDTLNINFKGYIDGELFDGGSADDQQLTIGSGSFIDNFEEQLIGSHPGDDVTVKVTFPEDYQSEDVAGKEAVFEVHVNGIY